MFNINKPSVTTKKPESSDQEQDIKREYYFRALIQARLVESLCESLDDAGFEPEDIEAFTNALGKLSTEDADAVLAIPYEVRERIFTVYEKKLRAGELSIAEVVSDLLAKNKAAGVTLGYHLSRAKIPKQQTPAGTHWTIKGTELDDRDNMPMAYYSEDYVHRYQTKGGRFLYVVRSEQGDNSTHKRDLANRWSRARALSIIDEYDMAEIEDEIDHKIASEKRTGAASALETTPEV
jgi:hypothetical protein